MRCPICKCFMSRDARDKEYNTNSCSKCGVFTTHDYKRVMAYRIERKIKDKTFVIVANRNSNKTGIFSCGKKVIMFDEFISIEKIMNKFRMVIVFS